MIRLAKEGDITWLYGLHPSDIPHPLPKGISVHIKQDTVGLEIQGLVGAIPLLNGDTLQIIPKIDRVNFLRLLFKAEGVQHDLEREYDDFVEYFVDNDNNIDSIVARQLVVSASEILNRSPKQGRIKRRNEGVFAAGQIDTVATALNIACHKNNPVVYSLREKTVNIPENRVITEALMRSWPMLGDVDHKNFKPILERWLSKFPRSTDLAEDLNHVEQGFASGKYGGPRGYYGKALMLSQIILGSNGLGFNEGAVIEGDAILLNSADIFEKFTRNTISEAYSSLGYVVTKGGVGVNSLYTDGSFDLQPDMVISKDNQIILIADAKYKKPTAGDHYQMHTYLAVNGVKRGMLISPLFAGNDLEIKEYSTANKMIIREVYLPMSDLAATEEFLGTVIERFS